MGEARRRLPLAALAAGLALTAYVTTALWENSQDHYDEQRTELVGEAATAIEHRTAAYVQRLEAVRALLHLNEATTAEEFNSFAAELEGLRSLPGLQAVGWHQVAGQTDDTLLELGFVESIERLPADVSDAALVTAPVELTTDDATVPGAFLLLPTELNGRVNVVVVAALRTEDLMTAAASDIGHGFVVHDIGPVDSQRSAPIVIGAGVHEADESAQVEISIHGRRWLISLPQDDGGPSPVGLILGAISGVALAIAFGWLVRETQRAASIADQESASLNAQLIKSNEELAIVGTRLERGIRSADILVWESNLTTGATWSSADPNHPEAGIENTFEERLHPEDRERVAEVADPQPGETREYEFRLADKLGEYRWVLSRSQGVMRGDDHVVIGAHIDITDPRRHTMLVERLNDDLTERNQALRDFTHVASHDLRSPLQAVGSLVAFLREDLPTDLAADAEHHLQRIDERVARMSQLIDDLLVYASAHNRTGHVEVVEVSDVLQDILDTIEIPDGISTVVHCDVPILSITTTPFATCVRNLIDNALKHHDKPDGRVEITAHIEDAAMCLEVTDNGPGIDPAYLPKIFEPFRRVRADETTPGSGIGLSVVERAATAQGGRVEVRSQLGEGSTFTLWWPIEQILDDALMATPASTSALVL